jgi:hypothetical protein
MAPDVLERGDILGFYRHRPVCGQLSGRDSPRGYAGFMTREDALAEVESRRASHPDATWIATQRGGEWIVARIGVTPTKPTGTATTPAPVAPRDDPHSPIERAAWFAGGGG